MITDEQYRDLIESRAQRPGAIAQAAQARKRRDYVDDGSGLLIVAADHSGRGVISAGGEPLAIGRRRNLLDRIIAALEHPAVDGVMATADIVEELLLLGALEDKLVIGSMNRSGVVGSAWELDDRFNCYDTAGIVDSGLDGGKMLMRVDLEDPASNPTIVACGEAVSELARAQVMALVEPLPYSRQGGRLQLTTELEAMIRTISVASALGSTSAFTWLKLPAVDRMEEVMAATSLPTLLLGGDPGAHPEAVYEQWRQALAIPHVRGLVAGRPLLYPPDGDITAVMNLVAEMMGRQVV